jgi:hypothetical protein
MYKIYWDKINSSGMQTEKIIFLESGNFFPFFLANSLQKKFSGEFYGIFDVPDRQKIFYQKQKLVDFKKIWFFHDTISKPQKNVDVEFLASFEEKYKINLWLLALNERLFYEYNEFYKFSREEILSILESECKLFEKILEIKPKFLISTKSVFHHHELFHQMCKVSGVKPLIFATSVFANRCIISEEPNLLDDKRTIEQLESSNRNFDELEKFWKKFEFRKQHEQQLDTIGKSKKLKINAGFDFIFSKNTTENNYGYYGHTKSKALSNYLGGITKKKIRRDYMDNNLSTTIDDKVPFVYFPLHQMPERELLIASPFNTNQIEIIRHISKSLPIGYKLYVKEHPTQVTREWRDISFYKEVLSIPNVEFLHHSIKSEDVLRKCSLVITIHGAAGLEAAIHKKPSIIFSDFNYSILPCVHKLKSIEELPDAIRSSLQTKVNASDVDKFLNLLEANSIDFSLVGFESDCLDYFHHGGNLLNVELDEGNVKQFIKKYEGSFNTLADEYVKKIYPVEK